MQDYSTDDFKLLGLIIAEFSDLILVPHVLAEVSSLARQIENPARRRIQTTLRTLIETTLELPARSASGAARNGFIKLGLTDAAILHLYGVGLDGISPTLLTADADLANGAHSLGYSVIDYKQECQAK